MRRAGSSKSPSDAHAPHMISCSCHSRGVRGLGSSGEKTGTKDIVAGQVACGGSSAVSRWAGSDGSWDDPSLVDLERFFYFDDADRALIVDRRGEHNRLGFAVQRGTVRFLGAFPADLLEVPWIVVDYLAASLGVADSSAVKKYAQRSEVPRDHACEIRRVYGYRDLSGPVVGELRGFIASRAWTRGEGPTALFEQATSWPVAGAGAAAWRDNAVQAGSVDPGGRAVGPVRGGCRRVRREGRGSGRPAGRAGCFVSRVASPSRVWSCCGLDRPGFRGGRSTRLWSVRRRFASAVWVR